MDVWFSHDCVCSNIEHLSNIDEMFSDSYGSTYQACLPAPMVTHLLRHDTFTYICMCVCKYTHITAYVMPRADIPRCQARKSRPGIAFQTLKLSSIKEVVFRGCVILRLSHNQFRFRFFIRFLCVMEFPTCEYKIW